MFFLADGTFPLRLNIIKPYSQYQHDAESSIANYHISRERRTIENSFGILAARFRIYHQPINAKVEHIQSYQKAAVVLHYFYCIIDPVSKTIFALTCLQETQRVNGERILSMTQV